MVAVLAVIRDLLAARGARAWLVAVLVVVAAFVAVRAPLWSGEPWLFPDSFGFV